jgi:hypothetical protein
MSEYATTPENDPNRTRGAVRAELRKLATAPQDMNGWRPRPAEPEPVAVAAVEFLVPEPTGMRSNPAQGSSGSTGRAPATGTGSASAAQTIRVKAARLVNPTTFPVGTLPSGN